MKRLVAAAKTTTRELAALDETNDYDRCLDARFQGRPFDGRTLASYLAGVALAPDGLAAPAVRRYQRLTVRTSLGRSARAIVRGQINTIDRLVRVSAPADQQVACEQMAAYVLEGTPSPWTKPAIDAAQRLLAADKAEQRLTVRLRRAGVARGDIKRLFGH